MNRKQRRAAKAKGLLMPKTQDEIKAQYAELCAKKGELEYQMEQLDLQSKEITKRLMTLNQEYHELSAHEVVKPKGAENVVATPGQTEAKAS